MKENGQKSMKKGGNRRLMKESGHRILRLRESSSGRQRNSNSRKKVVIGTPFVDRGFKIQI